MLDSKQERHTKSINQIRIEDVHTAYGKKEVLRGVSLSVGSGEIVAIIGPNGAGKSTLLRVIVGFLTPVIGQIWFNGKDMKPLSPHERIRLGLAYLMQGGKVFPSLTVLENLRISTIGLSSDNKDERISGLLEIFSNLRSLVNKRAGLLSGGERQALALAMVLVRRPCALFLDEPSAGLSPKLVQQMLEKIQEFNRTWNISILLVEQNARVALNIAHRAVMLIDGQIALETTSPRSWLDKQVLDNYFFGKTQNMEVQKQ